MRNLFDIGVLTMMPLLSAYTMIMSYPNLQDVADNLLPFFTGFFTLNGTVFFCFKAKPFIRLHDQLVKLSSLITMKEAEIVKVGTKKTLIFSKSYIAIGNCSVLLIMFGPGLISLYQYFTDSNTIVWRLPFFLKCPSILISTPASYGFVYLLLVYMLAVAVMSHYNDINFVDRSFTIKNYLEVLQMRFSQIDFNRSHAFRTHLIRSVNLHNEILVAIKEFQDGYGAMLSGFCIFAIATLATSIYGILKV